MFSSVIELWNVFRQYIPVQYINIFNGYVYKQMQVSGSMDHYLGAQMLLINTRNVVK